MEYKDNKQPSQQGHGSDRPDRSQPAAVPTTLLPTVLNRLGLTDRSMAEGDQVLAALRDERSSVRVATIRSLGERKEVSTLQFLVSALHDPTWEVRAAAVWALSTFGEYTPIEALIEALADKDGSVRAAALRVLAGERGRVPPESLAHLLNDEDVLVREAAASTVEELKEQAPTERLVTRLREEKTVERQATSMPQKQAPPDVHSSPSFTLVSAMQTQIMGDRYQLQEPIGRGGMATIYRGYDLRTNRVVAIKVLREAYSTDTKFVARFLREAKAASALKHPNIVEVYDYRQSDDNYYIVMELVEGTDLRRYLRSRGVLDVNRAVIIAHDVALGLAAAHRRGIVHRDVKPQNILVGHDGSIKLTDFGIVSMYQDINARRLTTTGMTLGTVQYYAPEQALGEIVSPAADVYELGIVMYEMLTGRTPFDGDSPVTVAMQHIKDAPIPPSQFNPSIPVALEEIILRCLEKVPEMRFRDGSRLARALEKLGDAKLGESITVTPGRTPILTTSQQIPSRPGNAGRGGTRENVPPDSIAAFADNRMDLDVLSASNDAGYIPGSPVNQPVYAKQQSFAPPSGSVPSYRFQPGIVRSSREVQPGRRNSRFARSMAILIPVVTLLLLGFSTYVAAELGFINLPFINNSNQTDIIPVPNLDGLSYQDALARTTQAGFKLRSQDGSQAGVVVQQVPQAGDTALKGIYITVQMGQLTPKPTLTVPLHLVGNTLAGAEQILKNAHIPYTVKSAGRDPGKGPNIVTNVVPAAGSSLQPGQSVTLYVVNSGVG